MNHPVYLSFSVFPILRISFYPYFLLSSSHYSFPLLFISLFLNFLQLCHSCTCFTLLLLSVFVLFMFFISNIYLISLILLTFINL
jgi:hypothetical protein